MQVWRNFTLRRYAIVAQNNVCVHALQQHHFTTLIATLATTVVVNCHVNVLHRTVGQERLAGGVKVKDRCQQSSLKSYNYLEKLDKVTPHRHLAGLLRNKHKEITKPQKDSSKPGAQRALLNQTPEIKV